MDPNKQQLARPSQGTPYISDFVAGPKAADGSVPATPPVAPQPATAPPLARGVPTPRPQQPQLLTSRPMAASTARPVSDVAAQPIQHAEPNPAQAVSTQPLPGTSHVPTPPRKSFEFQEPEAVSPGISDRKPQPHQNLRDVMSIFGVLASAMLLAFLLITFVFQSYQVDGPSMQTTLENNDHLIVWKVPKTLAKLTGQHYIPHRGDVVIFNEPTTAVGQEKQLIKRVIGLPGERVTVDDGVPTVYNKEHPDGFNPDKELPYGKVITTTNGSVDVTVKDNQVFVMGDNRTNSLDSRIFGPVSSDQLIGKLVLRVLPLNAVTKF